MWSEHGNGIGSLAQGVSELSHADFRRLHAKQTWEWDRLFDAILILSRSHMRMVAPTEPVPLRRNTTLDPSDMRMRMPCLEATEPSTGSLYSNSSAFAIENPDGSYSSIRRHGSRRTSRVRFRLRFGYKIRNRFNKAIKLPVRKKKGTG